MSRATRPLNNDEYTRMAAALASAGPVALPYAAICSLILGCGARIGEVLELTEGDLFEADGSPKTRITRTLEKKRGKRPVRLTTYFPWEVLGNSVIAWREVAKKRFFIERELRLFSLRYGNKAISRVRAWKYNKAFLIAAGIDHRGIGLHGLRKTFLTRIFFKAREFGMDDFKALRKVQELAGHSSMEVTMRYIGDSIDISERDLIEAAIADELRQKGRGTKLTTVDEPDNT